jgi:putative transposase
MRRAQIQGISGRPKFRRVAGVATAEDRVARQFHRHQADELWVTDVTEHPTREGKVYCAVVLDAWSRRVIGWSIDGRPTTALVTNALGMAIDQGQFEPKHHYSQRPGHTVHLMGVHQASPDSGLLPSRGSVGDSFDNAVMESFWSRVHFAPRSSGSLGSVLSHRKPSLPLPRGTWLRLSKTPRGRPAPSGPFWIGGGRVAAFVTANGRS